MSFQMYLETDALGVGLRASLLQTRDEVRFPKNEAPNNVALWPVGSVSKILTSTKTQYSNI